MKLTAVDALTSGCCAVLGTVAVTAMLPPAIEVSLVVETPDAFPFTRASLSTPPVLAVNSTNSWLGEPVRVAVMVIASTPLALAVVRSGTTVKSCGAGEQATNTRDEIAKASERTPRVCHRSPRKSTLTTFGAAESRVNVTEGPRLLSPEGQVVRRMQRPLAWRPVNLRSP